MSNPAFQTLAEKCKKIKSLLPDGKKFELYTAVLSSLISRIENLRTPTTHEYCQLLIEIHRVVGQITMEWVQLSPEVIVSEYVSRVNNPIYAQNHGTGHLVIDNPYETPNWTIRPAYYSICLPIPCEEIAMLIDSRHPKILPEIVTIPRDWSKVELWSSDAYKKFIE